jgi:hypothetical protein
VALLRFPDLWPLLCVFRSSLQAYRAKFAQPSFEQIDVLKRQLMHFHARQVALRQAADNGYGRLSAAWTLLALEAAVESFGLTSFLLDALPVLSSLQFVALLLAVAALPMLMHTARVATHTIQDAAAKNNQRNNGRTAPSWTDHKRAAIHVTAGALYLAGSNARKKKHLLRELR